MQRLGGTNLERHFLTRRIVKLVANQCGCDCTNSNYDYGNILCNFMWGLGDCSVNH